MHCPNCASPSVIKHGAHMKQSRAYQCQTCQHIFTLQKNRPQKRNRVLRWLAGTVAILSLSPWWVNKSLQVIVARPRPNAAADAIVVLGRGPNQTQARTDEAIKLWQNGQAPHIFISGILDAPIIIDVATDKGIPPIHISGESCSRSTWENAFYSAMLMPKQRLAAEKPTILLITDDLHIARATLIFRSFGFEVIPHPVRADFSLWRDHIFREFFVLAYYAASGRLKPPSPKELHLAQSDAKLRIPKRQCILTQK